MKIHTKIGINNILIIMLYLLAIFDTLRLVSFENISLLFLFIILAYYIIKMNFKIYKSSFIVISFAFLILISSTINILATNISFGTIARPIRIGTTLIVGYIYGQSTLEEERRNLYNMIFCISIVGAIWGFIQYFTGHAYESNFLRIRIASFFGNPIIYGSIIVGTIWLINYLSIDYIKRWVYWGILLVAVYSTSSRSSWIAIAIVFIIYIIMGLFSKHSVCLNYKMAISFGVGVIAILVFVKSKYFNIAVGYITSRFAGSLNGLMETKGAKHRIAMFIYLLKRFFQSNPFFLLFGHGPTSGNLAGRTGSVNIISGFSSADNEIVTFLYEYGLIAFALFIITIISIIRNLKNNNNEIRMLSYSILAMVITGLFYELLSWKSICELLMLYFGIFINLTVKNRMICEEDLSKNIFDVEKKMVEE